MAEQARRHEIAVGTDGIVLRRWHLGQDKMCWLRKHIECNKQVAANLSRKGRHED